jgi:alpha-galactosidase
MNKLEAGILQSLPPGGAKLCVETNGVEWRFEIAPDGRLWQRSLGGRASLSADPGPMSPAYPAGGDGWVFEPALQVTHADGNTSTDLRVRDWAVQGDTTRIELKDPQYPFFLTLCFRAIPELDVIESWTIVRHEESSAVSLQAYASSSLPFDASNLHLTQFHGDWVDEANLYTERLGPGIKILDSKLSSRAHQFTAPWFLLSRGPLKEEEGEIFGGCLAWSGSFRFSFELVPKQGIQAICGINPFGSALRLPPNEELTTPKMVWAWSGAGVGEHSRKLHRYVREHVIRDGQTPRPILLNNWEATYFKFDERKIVSLFDGAKDLGMELFLLDDGWFGEKYPRDDDTQGLGDWCTDPKKLPNGLSALTEAADERGLRFGLWFEPEMVNPRSELFERHPDWIVAQPKREIELKRNQIVLDLSRPEVREYAFRVLDDTLSANPGITYVKWDCNRYFTQPGSSYLDLDHQGHLPLEYTRGVYEVMERLAESHPSVQVMMCSGGGGRVDYGAMRFAHELWPSDMTDPERRIFIQWGFSHFYPAMAVANHVTRYKERPMSFAFDVAMSGRLGMDVDVEKLTPEDRRYSATAIRAYKGIRDVVQLGDLYRLESPYEGSRSALMYVLGERAVVFVYSLGNSPGSALPLRGLIPDRMYEVRPLVGQERSSEDLSGHDLMRKGLVIPPLAIHESRVFELTAAGQDL